MAHTLLFTMGYNAPDDRILPENFDWSDRKTLDDGLKTMTRALRPWTIDFHVAQNDATVKGSGSHDKTGPALPAQRSKRQARHRPARRILAERRQRHTHARGAAHLLGRLHVPERRDDAAEDVERRARRMVAVRDAQGGTKHRTCVSEAQR